MSSSNFDSNTNAYSDSHSGHDDKRPYRAIILVVIVLFIALMLFVYLLFSGAKNSLSGSLSGGSIAVIEVKGVILDSEETIQKLAIAEENKNTKAIIMRINSPGGAVAPVQEIYNEIKRINATIPIYSSFASISASGGYYIGAATREIYALPGTLTGSIGVIMDFVDLSKLLELARITKGTIKAGKYKDIGTPVRSMTEEEKSLMQGMISSVHNQFIADIVKTRKGKIKGDIRDHAQGQIFSGEKALELGLVDQMGSLWELGRRLHKDLKLSGEFKLNYIKLEKPFSIMQMLQGVESSISQIKEGVTASQIPLFLYR